MSEARLWVLSLCEVVLLLLLLSCFVMRTQSVICRTWPHWKCSVLWCDQCCWHCTVSCYSTPCWVLMFTHDTAPHAGDLLICLPHVEWGTFAPVPSLMSGCVLMCRHGVTCYWRAVSTVLYNTASCVCVLLSAVDMESCCMLIRWVLGDRDWPARFTACLTHLTYKWGTHYIKLMFSGFNTELTSTCDMCVAIFVVLFIHVWFAGDLFVWSSNISVQVLVRLLFSAYIMLHAA